LKARDRCLDELTLVPVARECDVAVRRRDAIDDRRDRTRDADEIRALLREHAQEHTVFPVDGTGPRRRCGRLNDGGERTDRYRRAALRADDDAGDVARAMRLTRREQRRADEAIVGMTDGDDRIRRRDRRRDLRDGHAERREPARIDRNQILANVAREHVRRRDAGKSEQLRPHGVLREFP
jgi:hypothetical protein